MSLAAKARKATHGERFQRWIERRERYIYGCVGPASVERRLLRECRIDRLDDLDVSEEAARRFRDICDDFVSEVVA